MPTTIAGIIVIDDDGSPLSIKVLKATLKTCPNRR